MALEALITFSLAPMTLWLGAWFYGPTKLDLMSGSAICCVTLGTKLNFSELQVPYL